MAEVPLPGEPACDGCLAEHRATLLRLRLETIGEIGAPPVAPEMASMIAVLGTALPLLALLHPALPVHPQVWQIGLLQAAVWMLVFFRQRQRYNRFHDHLQRKITAHQTAEGAALAPRLLKRRSFSPAHPGRRPATGLRQSAG